MREHIASQHAPVNELTPTQVQVRAADPDYSVWVGASAGSGKTKVLTDRVLRLLLPRTIDIAGSDPSRILCLTFTKAAANEMSLRLMERLSSWAVMDDAALRADLEDELFLRPPEDFEVAAARALFARVVDAPGGLQIMTIHSFCQSVLGRFPLEARVPPHFTGLDEGQAQALLRAARDFVLARAGAEKGLTRLGKALEMVAGALHEEGFDALIGAMNAERRQLGVALAGEDSIDTKLKKIAGFDPIMSDREIENSAYSIDNIDIKGIREVCRLLAEIGKGKNDKEKSVSIQNYLEADAASRPKAYPAYRDIFLKKTDGQPRKDIVGKPIQTAAPGIVPILEAEAQRLMAQEDRLKALRMVQVTGALLTIGAAILERYAELKRTRAALDFDDLIQATRQLLTRENMPWVMYKLDGGLDHILIDEAQDTNPEQWDIVEALAGEFFSGQGAREDKDPGLSRTIFSVGDEKQSIYSFQRAAPEKFHQMRARFSTLVKEIGKQWRDQPMDFSFRSAQGVLDFVDAVFAPVAMREGVSFKDIRHTSQRNGAAATVEIWPVFKTPEKEDRESWEAALDKKDSRSGSSRLAEHIGETIRGWIDRKEIIESYGRPIVPDDIMILVRRRNAFVNQVIRALKIRNIPVSGADRMVLRNEIAVQDLIAVAQAALLPLDDLSLACVMKSPLVGWSDEILEDIAHVRGRDESLADAIMKKAPDDVRSWLSMIREKAAILPPYEFFMHVLQSSCPVGKESGLCAMAARLGPEVLDPIDEFLNLSLSFEKDDPAALQDFILSIVQGESTIRREQEESGGQVRIMTVHGAKGLQAPVVILPDTMKSSGGNDPGRRLLWPDKTGLKTPLWSPGDESDCSAFNKAYESLNKLQEQEYKRLFYVAMTRAADRLYIAGYAGRKKAAAGGWYDMAVRAAQEGFEPELMENVPFESRHFLRTEEDDPPVMMRLKTKQTEKAVEKKKKQQARHPIPGIPEWLRQAPPDEPLPPRPLVPSRASDNEETRLAARSPLAGMEGNRFRRGIITHRLLQILPGLPDSLRKDAAGRFLETQGSDLAPALQDLVAGEVMAILEHTDYAPLFGPLSRAEVPVTGYVGGRLISGQIDRLYVTDQEVWIVDYKTNRPPPEIEKDIPVSYRQQMKAYAGLIAAVYPGRRVRTFLLWTDGARLMEITT